MIRRGPAPLVKGASWAAAAAGALVLALVAGFLVAGVGSGRLDWARLMTSPVWDPARGRFGATAMIWGTAAVAVIALAIAAPVGWAAAVAVSELAPPRWRRLLRSGAELLAVVPSIVFGLVGVAYVRPLVSGLFGVPGGDSLMAAGLVLAAMVVPTVVAVSVDALASVPGSLREAAAAAGLTRTEVIVSAVLPQARRGMGAGLLLGLARALGETVAVFLVVGRADGRVPGSLGAVADLVVRPGQTLTTKLNGPESVLAGTAGPHWAALCGLGLVLLAAVVVLTVWGQPGPGRAAHPRAGPAGGRGRGARRWRRGRDRLARWATAGVLALPFAAVVAIGVVVVARGSAALDPRFWTAMSQGASGGGIRAQLAGTALMVATAGVIAAPVGLGLGLALAEYARPGLARGLRTLTLTLGGVPSILLGLWGYWLLSTRLGWGKSWLAGSMVLAVVAVPPVVVAVAAAAAALPPDRREAAGALGLRREQVVRSVVLPQAVPGLVTGLLLGLARAAGETAPLLFTATVFNGAPVVPAGIRQSPVASLPTHIFVLAQDAADPGAIATAWGSALALVAVAGVLVAAAVPARRLVERRAGGS